MSIRQNLGGEIKCFQRYASKGVSNHTALPTYGNCMCLRKIKMLVVRNWEFIPLVSQWLSAHLHPNPLKIQWECDFLLLTSWPPLACQGQPLQTHAVQPNIVHIHITLEIGILVEMPTFPKTPKVEFYGISRIFQYDVMVQLKQQQQPNKNLYIGF